MFNIYKPWSNIIGEKADIVLNKPVSYAQLRDLGVRIFQNLSGGRQIDEKPGS